MGLGRCAFVAPPAALVLLGAVVLPLVPDCPIRWLSNFEDLGGAGLLLEPQAPNFSDILVSTHPAGPFVLVVEPKHPRNPPGAEWLASWLEKQSSWLRDAFFRHGAIILRGFDVRDGADFERVALAVNPDLAKAYLGTSPRSKINNTQFVHTAADFQPHRTVPAHLEMSFRDSPPELQMFFAKRLDHTQGGETPLVDFRGVWSQLQQDPVLEAKFAPGRTVRYVRNYDDCASVSKLDPLMQKCWGEMFMTGGVPDSREEVLRKCAAESFECSWDASGTLKIVNSQPWVRKHPVSGDATWFNHMNVLKPESMVLDYERTAMLWGGWKGLWPLLLGCYYRALFALLGLFREEPQLGSTTLFEDGSLVARADFLAVKRAIWRNTVQAPYHLHDIVIVDNLRIGHGREIYLGSKDSRQILTAWSDKYPAKWF